MVKKSDFKSKKNRNIGKSVIKSNYKEVLLNASIIINQVNNLKYKQDEQTK